MSITRVAVEAILGGKLDISPLNQIIPPFEGYAWLRKMLVSEVSKVKIRLRLFKIAFSLIECIEMALWYM